MALEAVRNLAWLAGLMEGEGCFTISGPSPYRYASAYVSMTDRDVIEAVTKWLNTNIPPEEKNKGVPGPKEKPLNVISYEQKGLGGKTMFRVGVTGRRARVLMYMLHPFMLGRRSSRIDDVLEKTAK